MVGVVSVVAVGGGDVVVCVCVNVGINGGGVARRKQDSKQG